MTRQVSVRLPDPVVDALDSVARKLGCNRSDVVRIAVEHYLADSDDLSIVSDRLRDPADQALDWNEIRHELLDAN